jgi:limonene-1,2-epoxide hydrolase
MTDATRTPTDIVTDFCAAWARLAPGGASTASGGAVGIDELLGYFTPDAVYHNIPVDPVVGVDAIRSMMQMFTTGVERIEFRVQHMAANGNVVMTERVDVFVQPERTIELPVMGTFEIVDGKIAAWRDYFDLNQYMSQAGLA